MAVVSIVAFREDDNAFPAGGGKQEVEDQRERDIGGEQEGVGASGSLRSLVIFITRKRLTLLFVPPSISPTNLWSIFKLTGHSNKFSLFSRHYKYNLEREYSRSRILLIVSSLVLFFVLSAMKENFGRKTRRFLSLFLSLDHIALDFVFLLRYQSDME